VNHRAISFSIEEGGQTGWNWMVFLSVLLHCVALMAIWGLERYTPRRTLDPSVISVRLVGALPTASLSPAPQSSSSQPATQNRPAPAEEKPASAASRIPLPVPQAERKAVSINPTEVKAPERTTAPQKIETPPPPAKSPLGEPGGGSRGAETSPKVAAAAPGGGGGGKLTPEEARYLQMLQERIEENWRAYLPPDEGVLGEVRIQIGPDGRIREFTFVKGSGKSHVDSSIVTALKKVALAPPPASIADRPLVLRFWPSGPKS
jgi:outer membrane biosynthesis protein TonB